MSRRDVDAVPADERQLLEERSASGVLAGERLDDRRELREEQRQRRAGDELGDASAAVVPLAQGPRVEALHEADLRAVQQWAGQSEHVVRVEVVDVGVAPHDDVAVRCEQGLPERLTLAVALAVRAAARRRR